jgi:hypothetical protein
VKSQWPQIFIAMIFTTGFMIILMTIFSGEEVIAPKMTSAAMTVLGILSAGQGQIMSYFFGSNLNSSKKDHTINQLTKDGSP